MVHPKALSPLVFGLGLSPLNTKRGLEGRAVEDVTSTFEHPEDISRDDINSNAHEYASLKSEMFSY